VVERAGQAVELTAREYALLEYLMRNSNRLVTRRMIENSLWSYESTVASNVVDVYIRRLRLDPARLALRVAAHEHCYRMLNAIQRDIGRRLSHLTEEPGGSNGDLGVKAHQSADTN